MSELWLDSPSVPIAAPPWPGGGSSGPATTFQSSIWAALPAAAGVSGQFFKITDYGNVLFFSDGTNYYPAGGMQTLYAREGSIAAPVSTIAGNGALQLFVLPQTLRIPVGMLVPGRSRVRGNSWFRRTVLAGAPGVTGLGILLGSTNSTADNFVSTASVAATVNQDYDCDGYASISTTTTYAAMGGILWNQTIAASVADRTTNFNTAVDNYVNFRTSPSLLVGDTVIVLQYSVSIEGTPL